MMGPTEFLKAPPMTMNTALAAVSPSHVEQRCIDSGMKMTGQRRIIARVLSGSLDHPDVEEVHRRASAEDSRISIATVYRTMRLFEDAGIVQRHEFGDRRSRYEEVPDTHHDHLVDIRSGKVIEFRNEDIERLQQEIARKHGFKLVSHKLELFVVPLNEGDVTER
jgi:Fur family transcriptional regulator, ferric uptake regulator